MRRGLVVVLACAVPLTAGAHIRRDRALFHVIAPLQGAPAPAHPFVNIIVRFNAASNGTQPDVPTFRARLGRADVTEFFAPLLDAAGKPIGVRAALGPPVLRVGRQAVNRLRLSVRSLPVAAKGGHRARVFHDTARVHFRALSAADQPPEATAVASADTGLPGVPVQFDASNSTDPEGDVLTSHWDFGDGTGSDETRPTHTFGPCTADMRVRLTVSDVCGDGAGGLYLLSDDGTYTDPSPNPVTELTETVLRLRFDANGNRTDDLILARETTGTQFLACGGPGDGRLYLAEHHSVNAPPQCFRADRESLTTLREADGQSQVLLPRIDAVEGLDACNDDLDPVQSLGVVRDGSAVFAALGNGLFRIYPTPLLITPSITDFFGVDPHGSVLAVTATDIGPTGLVSLYSISPEQAAHGAPLLSELTPCATFPVPNNGGRTSVFNSFSADRAATGSSDAVVLASFVTNGATKVLSPALGVRGTVAFSAAAGPGTCSVLGLINLEFLDSLAF